MDVSPMLRMRLILCEFFANNVLSADFQKAEVHLRRIIPRG